MAVWFVILARNGGIDWHFFVQGTDLLFSGHDGASTLPANLHLYASYPQLQIGPAAYPVAEALRHLGPDYGLVTAQIVMSAMGLLVIALIQRVTLIARPDLARPAAGRAHCEPAPLEPGRFDPAEPGPRLRAALLAGGSFFVIAWQELAVAHGHLDDSLALTCAALAVWAWVSGRPAAAGLAIGLAAAAKPWAWGYLAVLALPQPERPQPERPQPERLQQEPLPRLGPAGSGFAVRQRVVAAGCVAGVTAAAWLPFFLADPATMNAMHFKIANMPDSALRALGVTASMTPSWDRPAQIAIGIALGVLAIARGRWPAVLLLAAGARIALDPGVHSYYTPEVMTGALLWDLAGTRRSLPLWSVISFGALNLTPLLTEDAAARGAIRLGVVIAFAIAVFWPGRPRRSQASQVSSADSLPAGAALEHAGLSPQWRVAPYRVPPDREPPDRGPPPDREPLPST
jgi:hypothetical protein